MNFIKRYILNNDSDDNNIMNVRQNKIQQWTCKFCTFSANDISTSKCEVCHNFNSSHNSNVASNIEQPQKVWKCKVCTLINNYNDAKCHVCDTAREDKETNDDSVIILDDDENENYEIIKNGCWICKQCTFINNKSSDKCDICGTFNDVIRNERISTAKMWTCDICSSKNRNIKSNVCEVCGYSTQTSQLNRQNTFFDNSFTSLDNSMQSLKSNRAQQSKAIHDIYTHSIEEAIQLWKNIVFYCQKNKHKFIDDGFPPCDKSLFSDEKTKEKILGRKIRAIQWLHPEQIRVRNEDTSFKWTVYLKNPTFHDIKQGHLGNCWFLSALAVILDRPEIIQKILVTKEFCPEGCYLVRLCHNGEWKIVMIDDLFPCDENGYLLYSKAHKRQLWVALIEKALAKLNKSYEALIAGHTIEGLATLTGYPCESIRFETDTLQDEATELNWAKLLSSKEAGFAIGAACYNKSLKEADYEKLGLLANHAYSILDVKELHGLRLLQVRNPWGRISWKGNWSFNSPSWTPELLNLFKINPSTMNSNADNGIFWMSYFDFVKYFHSVDICKINPNWMEARMTGFFVSHECRDILAYQLHIFETTMIEMSLFQRSDISRKDTIDSDLLLLVFRTRRPQLQFITSSKRLVRHFINKEHMFGIGDYTILPLSFNFWYTTNKISYNLAVHGSKPFILEQSRVPHYYLADALIALALNIGKRSDVTFNTTNIYTLSDDFSGLIVVAENLDPYQHFHVEITGKQPLCFLEIKLNT